MTISTQKFNRSAEFVLGSNRTVKVNGQNYTEEKHRQNNKSTIIEYTLHRPASNPDAEPVLVLRRVIKKIGFFTKLMNKITAFFLNLFCCKKPKFLTLEIDKNVVLKNDEEHNNFFKAAHCSVSYHSSKDQQFFHYDESSTYRFTLITHSESPKISVLKRVNLTEEQWIASLNQPTPPKEKTE